MQIAVLLSIGMVIHALLRGVFGMAVGKWTVEIQLKLKVFLLISLK